MQYLAFPTQLGLCNTRFLNIKHLPVIFFCYCFRKAREEWADTDEKKKLRVH